MQVRTCVCACLRSCLYAHVRACVRACACRAPDFQRLSLALRSLSLALRCLSLSLSHTRRQEEVEARLKEHNLEMIDLLKSRGCLVLLDAPLCLGSRPRV